MRQFSSNAGPRLLSCLLGIATLGAFLLAGNEIALANYHIGALELALAAGLGQRAFTLWRSRSSYARDFPSALLITGWILLHASIQSNQMWWMPMVLLLTVVVPSSALWTLLGASVAGVGISAYLNNGTQSALELAAMMLLTGTVMAFKRSYADSAELFASKRIKRLEIALQSTEAGTLEWDLQTKSIAISARLREMLMYDSNDRLELQSMLELVHPDDQDELQRFLALQFKACALQNQSRLRSQQFRICTKHASYRWVRCESILLCESGIVRHLICTLINIDAAVQQEIYFNELVRKVQSHSQALLRLENAFKCQAKYRGALEDIALHHVPIRIFRLRESLRPQIAQACASSGASEECSEKILALLSTHAKSLLVDVRLEAELMRMEEGTYAFDAQDVDLAAVVNCVVQECVLLSKECEVQLEWSPLPEGSLAVRGEHNLCRAATDTLLRHGVKLATAHSTVIVRAHYGTRRGIVLLLQPKDATLDPQAVLDADILLNSASAIDFSLAAARLMVRIQGGDLDVIRRPHGYIEFSIKLPAETSNAAQWPADLQSDFGYVEQLSYATSAPQDATEQRTLDMVAVHHGSAPRTLEQLIHCVAPLCTPRQATDLQALEAAVVERRPDVIVFCVQRDAPLTLMLEMATAIRKMQRSALEDVSTMIALLCEGSPAVDAELQPHKFFDHLLHFPQDQHTLRSVLESKKFDLRAANGQAWVERAMVDAYPDYIASRLRIVEDLDRAVAQGRNRDAAFFAHTLAGSPALHQFAQGIQLCRSIEDLHAKGQLNEAVRLREVRRLREIFSALDIR